MVVDPSKASNGLIIYVGSTREGFKDLFALPTASLTFAGDDKIRIGGPNSFIGSISNFQIYYPGSNLLNTGTILLFKQWQGN